LSGEDPAVDEPWAGGTCGTLRTLRRAGSRRAPQETRRWFSVRSEAKSVSASLVKSPKSPESLLPAHSHEDQERTSTSAPLWTTHATFDPIGMIFLAGTAFGILSLSTPCLSVPATYPMGLLELQNQEAP